MLQQRWRTILATILVTLAGFVGGQVVYDQFAVAGIQIEPEEAAFITLLNNYRTSNGLPPLTVDAQLQKAAEAKSQDMADHNYFSHTSFDGRDPFKFMCDEGGYCSDYAWKGENLGAGYATGQAVFTGWQGSAGHNSNMLGANYIATGIARVSCSSCTYGFYWTSEFGSILSSPFVNPTPTTAPVTPTLVPIKTAVPTNTVIPTPTPCPGDFNGDRLIDITDFVMMVGYFGQAVTPANAPLDLAPDGFIDIGDMVKLTGRLGACKA